MMDFDSYLVFVPASIALAFKAGILAYAQRSPIRNSETRLFLYFLIAMSLQNIAELGVFSGLQQGQPSVFSGKFFYSSSIIALAILFHLALSLSMDLTRKNQRLLWFVYIYAVLLEVLLFSTKWLIEGVTPIQYTVTRIPGPLYALFEIYAIGLACALIGLLYYGARYQQSPTRRSKAATMLLALIPLTVLIISVLVLLHFEIHWINGTLTSPIAITYFLLVTAFAIYRHRMFDIHLFYPWSKFRKLLKAITVQRSADKVLNGLSEVLQCPTALIWAGSPLLATNINSSNLAMFPKTNLKKHDRVLIADEIEKTYPETFILMKRHGAAAMMPFNPSSRSSYMWLLLGERSNNSENIKIDYLHIEQLFEDMADMFLDQLLTKRIQSNETYSHLQELTNKHTDLANRVARLESDNRVLRETNQQLIREQPADSLTARHQLARYELDDEVTLLGSNRPLKQAMEAEFPHLKHYSKVTLRNYEKQTPTHLLIAAPSPSARITENKRLLQLITGGKEDLAALLYGLNSKEFIAEYRDHLFGRIVEVTVDSSTAEVITRKARALLNLRKVVHSLAVPECPLLGISAPFMRFIQELQRISKYDKPIWLVSHDKEFAVAAYSYIHYLSRYKGALNTIHTNIDYSELANSFNCPESTIVIVNLTNLSSNSIVSLGVALAENNHRKIIVCHENRVEDFFKSDPDFFGSVNSDRFVELTVPSLGQRELDLPFLVHYFTIQFNLHFNSATYLSKDQADRICNNIELRRSIRDLRNRVWEVLNACSSSAGFEVPDTGNPSHGGGRHLDELMSSFEIQIIEDALRRCDGNKSRAARLLGIRSNTLYYKIERYKIVNSYKNSSRKSSEKDSGQRVDSLAKQNFST